MLGFDAPVKIEIPGYNAGTDDDKPKYDVKQPGRPVVWPSADNAVRRISKDNSPRKEGRNNGKANECC